MNAYFLSLKEDTPTSGFWDYAILDDILDGVDRLDVRTLPKEKYAIVVIPGRSHHTIIDKVNKELAKIQRVIVFIMGDEEHQFPVEQISHPHAIVWVQNPKMGRHDSYRKIGCGYTPAIKDFPRVAEWPKIHDVFFAGQVTHERRRGLIDYLRAMTHTWVLITFCSQAFTQGIEQIEYYMYLYRSKVALCPSGPQTPDTFRLYEALELGCIPIADEETPKEELPGFWHFLFGEDVPFPVYTNITQVPEQIKTSLESYPKGNNRVQAWWYRQKRKWREQLRCNIEDLGAPSIRANITAIIPSSPLPRHPDITLLEETIESLRYHGRVGEIILTFDGIRKEHEHLRENYEEYIRRVLQKIPEWKDVTPFIFDEHLHQVEMFRRVIDSMKTPLVLYVEQDTPLVTDEPIEWELLENHILEGRANVIRFHFEGRIPEAHNHLMLPSEENETHLRRTIQWSQRPHLASVPFYAAMLNKHFSPNARCFIEDKLHGVVQDDYNISGLDGWAKWKLFIYTPNDTNIKRSYHTDGRAGAAKLDETQIW